MAIARNILALAVVSSALVLVNGCGSGPKDVANDPAFGDFKSVVGNWKTKVPLTLVENENKLYLVYGDAHLGAWRGAPRELPAVPIGTEIRIEHLIFRTSLETSFLDATGSFVAGPYAGKSLILDRGLFGSNLVEHYWLYHGDSSDPKWKWTVAPDKLERLTPASAPQK